MGAYRCWCAAWTSNPVIGANHLDGGFDSHTLPPSFFKYLQTHKKWLAYCINKQQESSDVYEQGALLPLSNDSCYLLDGCNASIHTCIMRVAKNVSRGTFAQLIIPHLFSSTGIMGAHPLVL